MPQWSWIPRRRARLRIVVALLVSAVAAGVGSGLLSPTPARALPAGETWAAELSIGGGDDTNVVAANGAIRLGTGTVRPLSARSPRTQGELILPPRRPAIASTRVSADLTADMPPGTEVEISVRGTQSDGSWSEWTPATRTTPAQLTDPAVELQVKVLLVANQYGVSPSVQRLWLTADRVGAPGTSPTAAPTTTRPGTTTTRPSTTTTTPSTTTTTTTTTRPGTTTTTPSSTTPSTTTRPSTTTPSATPSTIDPTSPSTAPSTSTSTTTPSGTTSATPLAASTGQPITVPPFTKRVYATRIGLAGNNTANGHLVANRDHFVALPSRRSVAPNNTGDYTVKVCADNGRCSFAPVWDVGPWNTADNYWDGSVARLNFSALTQGIPEAQAAYQGGFNGGKDGFGRRVGNAAGIDLADGTYWDDLGLTDNTWVTVSYLWTGRGAVGIARPGSAKTLVVRNGPNTSAAVVGAVGATSRVPITCTATGPAQNGTQGTSNQWLKIGPSQYVPAAGVEGPSGLTPC